MITTLRLSCQALSNVPDCWSVVRMWVDFLGQNDCSRMPRNKTVPKDSSRKPEFAAYRLWAFRFSPCESCPDLRVSAGKPVPRLDRIGEIGTRFPYMGKSSSRSDIHASRQRILMIFLLIRYTGARLNEVLALDLRKDIDMSGRVVRYGILLSRQYSFARGADFGRIGD